MAFFKLLHATPDYCSGALGGVTGSHSVSFASGILLSHAIHTRVPVFSQFPKKRRTPDIPEILPIDGREVFANTRFPKLHTFRGLDFREVLQFRRYRGDEIAWESIIKAGQSATPIYGI